MTIKPKCEEIFVADIKKNGEKYSAKLFTWLYEFSPYYGDVKYRELSKHGRWKKATIGSILEGNDAADIIKKCQQIIPAKVIDKFTLVVPNKEKTAFDDAIKDKKFKVQNYTEGFIATTKESYILSKNTDGVDFGDFTPNLVVIGNLGDESYVYENVDKCPDECFIISNKKYIKNDKIPAAAEVAQFSDGQTSNIFSDAPSEAKNVAWFTTEDLKMEINYAAADNKYDIKASTINAASQKLCTSQEGDTKCHMFKKFANRFSQPGAQASKLKIFEYKDVDVAKFETDILNNLGNIKSLSKVEETCDITSAAISSQFMSPLCMFLLIFIIVFAGKIMV